MRTFDDYLGQLKQALDAIDRSAFDAVLDELKRAQADDRCVYICGNGGSASTASHMVNDLVKAPATVTGCRPIRAFGLADCVSLMTALANDLGYEKMFSEQVKAYGRPGDLLVAISASGNSPNVLQAAKAAQEIGMTVVGMTAFTGGALREMADICVHVPCENFGLAEDAHLIVEHALVEVLKNVLRDAPKS